MGPCLWRSGMHCTRVILGGSLGIAESLQLFLSDMCRRFNRCVTGGGCEGLNFLCLLSHRGVSLPAGKGLRCLHCQREFSPRKFLLRVPGWEHNQLPVAGRERRQGVLHTSRFSCRE